MLGTIMSECRESAYSRRRFLEAAVGTTALFAGCTSGQSSSDGSTTTTTTESSPAADMPSDFTPLSSTLGYKGSLPLYDLRKEITADRQQPGVNMDTDSKDEVDAFFKDFTIWYNGSTYQIVELPLYSVNTQYLSNYWVGEWEKDPGDGVEFGGGVFMFWEPGPHEDDVTGDLEVLPPHDYYFVVENPGDGETTMFAVDEDINAEGFDFVGDTAAFESEYGVSLSGY